MQYPKTIPGLALCAIIALPTASDAQQLFTANSSLSGSQISAPRGLNYWPEGEDFVTYNGRNRFTRALYGGNSGFRVETSDCAEFALYMPNMGGNIRLSGYRRKWPKRSVWYWQAQRPLYEVGRWETNRSVESRYRPGHRSYRCTLPESVYGAAKGVTPTVEIDVVAAYDCDAAIWHVRTTGVAKEFLLKVDYCGASNDRFSREGDMGVDKKDCFDPRRCEDNVFVVDGTHFLLKYGSQSKRGERQMVGYFSTGTELRVDNYLLEAGIVMNRLKDKDTKTYKVGEEVEDRYFLIGNAESVAATAWAADLKTAPDSTLKAAYERASADADRVASTIRIETPDPFFNTLGGVMATAADAIWGEEGVWLHGAIGWRMPLLGWRAAYTGDVVGRHDRARTHFDNYAASQLTDVPPIYDQPMQDTSRHLARGKEKFGTPIYSNGYICRMPNSTTKLNHYDMNLVYIDELLWHFNWTGDLAYAAQMWPVLTRHLAWEDRNFDPNGDGLYDAYCCIWASDALYYSGSAVTHSSAYNYRAHKQAAMIADLLQRAVDAGEMPAPEGESYATQAAAYAAQADRILSAMNARLWMPAKGVWAEYQDALGLQRRHEAPALWTVYHAIDSETATPRQAYEATRYVDRQIPHIPLKVLSPTATDSLHEAKLAAISAIADGGYATVSTTNWQPYAWSINNVALAEVAHTALAYWQAGRADAGFTLLKSALLDAMYLGASPGNFGQISYYDAARSECYRDFGDPVGITSRTLIQGLFGVRPDRLNGRLYWVPGFPSAWDHAAFTTPDYALAYRRDTVEAAVRTTYTYSPSVAFATDTVLFHVPAYGAGLQRLTLNGVEVSPELARVTPLTEAVETPMLEVAVNTRAVQAPTTDGRTPYELALTWRSADDAVARATGDRSDDGRFERYTLGDLSWWMPLGTMDEAYAVVTPDDTDAADFGNIPASYFTDVDSTRLEMLNLSPYFNENVTEIFQQQYLSPRAQQTTLALPTQGYGEWCHPLDTFTVDDAYLRQCGARSGYLTTPLGVPFRTPGRGQNILFTSQWDNYPTSATVPLTGRASHIYVMMAGSTNAMQSRIANGALRVRYADGTADSLLLVNPETWWPIDQDYLDGTPAFYLRRPAPYRQCLATEECYRPAAQKLNRLIPGGAALLLDLPVRSDCDLKALELETLSNDVVIGLMSVTLQR
jgi:hypothetical protein